ncbi:hypothetical protein EDB86DRAFT_2824916 [Lactarius hatsudake]|nr:hypothetical protein EDB86DRAFT_2824916 [Lactarius hatsudake]
MQIAQHINLGNKPSVTDITSVFTCMGVPGLIFLEGNLIKVTCTVQGLITIITHLAPFLVPLKQCVTLLSPRNPLSHPIKAGQWDTEIIVTLVPQIPKKTTRTTKWKKVAQPEPQNWSAEQLKVSWGTSKIQWTSSEEYIFSHEKYRSGLIVKQLSC